MSHALSADALPITPTVLVVDDSPVDRRLTAAVVENALGWQVVFADQGEAALQAMERSQPDLVLTDLQMPQIDGLSLVAHIRRRFPLVPVVSMTAFGSETIAMQALCQGAASYVPKRSMELDLAPTLEQVWSAAQSARRQKLVLERLVSNEMQFVLENNKTLLPGLIQHLQEAMQGLGLGDRTMLTRIGVALEEALLNAVYHGNLEVSSDLRQNGDDAFYRLADQRSRSSPYAERRVYVTARLTRQEAVFMVRDQGPGFNPNDLPDPTDPANLEKCSGRGLLLIRAFMDEVRYNATGNEITMVKRRDPS